MYSKLQREYVCHLIHGLGQSKKSFFLKINFLFESFFFVIIHRRRFAVGKRLESVFKSCQNCQPAIKKLDKKKTNRSNTFFFTIILFSFFFSFILLLLLDY